MNILNSTSSFVRALVSSPRFNSLHSPTFACSPNINSYSSHPIKSTSNPFARQFPISASNQATASVADFEEFVEKDWSFLDFDDASGDGERVQRIDRIISAGNVKETSKILVSFGSEAFVGRIVGSSPCEQLLVVHESLLILACIKEGNDGVKCWQGELVDLPEKWTDFDAVYLCFLPALSPELDRILAALAKRCLPGARVVIGYPDGRVAVEELQRQYPDAVVSGLPEKTILQATAANHSFEVVEFTDEPEFYLAVLRFNEG